MLPTVVAGRILEKRQQIGALKIAYLAIEHLRHGRVGELDATVLADHQDTLGGVGQHRGVECPGAFELLGKCL